MFRPVLMEWGFVSALLHPPLFLHYPPLSRFSRSFHHLHLPHFLRLQSFHFHIHFHATLSMVICLHSIMMAILVCTILSLIWLSHGVLMDQGMMYVMYVKFEVLSLTWAPVSATDIYL